MVCWLCWIESRDKLLMMQVFQIHSETGVHSCGHPGRWLGPAADGPLAHQSTLLIGALRDLSGVPMASFNENEPVVCEPKEALECFLRTRMHSLAMGEAMSIREHTMRKVRAEPN